MTPLSTRQRVEGIELEFDDATQYATAYRNGVPVATIWRRRVYETGPVWRVYDETGTLMFTSLYTSTPKILARRIERTLIARRGK